VTTGELIGASADRTESVSLDLTMARSMNSPSMRLRVLDRVGQAAARLEVEDSAPVPKCTSRSSSAVVRLPFSLSIQAIEVAMVECGRPGARPMKGGGANAGARRWQSVRLGALSVTCAWVKASRSTSGLSG